jgi:hypothetical protein
MVELPDPLYNNTLQEISIWQDRHSSSSAMIFMNSILATPFIITLDVLQKCFSYTLLLSKAVQTIGCGLESATKSYFGYHGTIKRCAKLIARYITRNL